MTKHEKHKYYIHQCRKSDDGTVYEFVECFGERVMIYGFVCFIRKEKAGWRVTEATSGMAVGPNVKTKKEALEKAVSISVGHAEFERVIRRNIIAHGRSPWGLYE
jgi:hypothetical protein